MKAKKEFNASKTVLTHLEAIVPLHAIYSLQQLAQLPTPAGFSVKQMFQPKFIDMDHAYQPGQLPP